MKWKVAFVLLLLMSVALPVQAQTEVTSSDQAGHTYVERARVLSVVSEEERKIPGTETVHSYQVITARVESGHDKGAEITVQNDYLNLKVGEQFYLMHSIEPSDGTDSYNVTDPYRLPSLLGWIAVFVVLTIIFGD